jgi:ATP-dependent Lon protease
LIFFDERTAITMAEDKVSMSGAGPLSAGARSPEQVPILPLRDTVLFPQSALPLGAGRESSV